VDSEPVVAKSWSNALELLYVDSWRDDLRRYRSRIAFRGLSDSSYSLKTSLIRLDGPFQSLERHLLRNFAKYARLDDTEQGESDWRCLTLGQHHGLPTRLLDWTYSPFAALHFCTSNLNNYDRDGVIWCVDYTKAHDLLPDELREQKKRTGSDVFSLKMLEQAAPDLDSFDGLMKEPFAVFFEPPSWDDRIVNQFALFSVLSDSTLPFDEWLSHGQVPYRLVHIPAQIKWEIRDKLDQANMSERVFFPGLDGLAAWLRRHYSSR